MGDSRTCLLGLVLAAALAVAGCGDGDTGESAGAPSAEASRGGSSSAPPSAPAPTTSELRPRPGPTCAQRLVARMTPRERAGQLLMVGVGSTSAVTGVAEQVSTTALGGVFFLNPWYGRDAVAAVSDRLQQAVRGPVGLLVAADQEGGEVQRLVGEGFSEIPSATAQGEIGHDELRKRTTTWAAELREAGVNVNLAPVADTVPEEVGPANEPIGALDRDFVPGSPRANGGYVAVSVRGHLAADVAPTLKHFPGLGRVTGNTDHTATGITDTTTTADDRYLWPFRVGIRAGAPLVMLSSAVYPRIDPDNPAMFSEAVVTGVLRERLGFDGVVISDDVGAAQAVADVPVGERATRFIAAGGDVVITADPSQSSAMIEAILTRRGSDPVFGREADAAAVRVLDLKVDLGLAGC